MAREGFFFSLPFLLLAILFFYLFQKFPHMDLVYLAVSSLIVAFLFMSFFRDPDRRIPEGDGIIVSPADGRVVALERREGCFVVSIFLSIFNVHINRVPVSGVVQRVKYQPGKFRPAFQKKAAEQNERFEITIKADNYSIDVHQVAGILARRVVCRLTEGQEVRRGERFGMIRFGSRVDLMLPLDTSFEVQEGKRVKGGSTIIGRLA